MPVPPRLSAPVRAHVVDPSAAIQREGFVIIPHLFDPQMIAATRHEAVRLAARHAGLGPPHSEFLPPMHPARQVRNGWLLGDDVRKLVCSSRLAALAGRLLDAKGVQLYADLVVLREAGATAGLWHNDSAYIPVAPEAIVIAMIPLEPMDSTCGSLGFMNASHLLPIAHECRAPEASGWRDTRRELRRAKLQTTDPSYAPGDVCFYSGLTFHRANANHTAAATAAIYVIYVKEGAVLSRPRCGSQALERERHFADCAVGKPITTPQNPLLWRAAHHPSVRESQPAAG